MPARSRQPSATKTKASRATKPDALAFFKTLHDLNPEPKGELESVNDFTFLVAVVLSAQATDKGVNKATRGLFAAADTPAKMMALGEAGIRDHIKTIGLFNAKAKNVYLLCKALVEEHNSTLPRTREGLMALPGVGRKTANVVLNTLYGQPTIAVDTHLFRVANRTGLAKGKTPLTVEQKLEKVVPEAYKRHAHHWLILHGRYICVARTPRCAVCPVAAYCGYAKKQLGVNQPLTEK